MFVKEVNVVLIRNSRGERTIKVNLRTYRGEFSASAPSGKSTGRYEVSAWSNSGIGHSLKIAGLLCRRLKHQNIMIKKFEDLKLLRAEIGKVENKFGKMGGNVVYAFETVFLKAAAKGKKKELWEFVKGDSRKPIMPIPVGNCMGGGLHSSGKRPDFQEFLLIGNEKKFSRNVTKIIHAYDYARKLIKKAERRWRVKKNDEGAWETGLTNEEVLEILFQVGKKYNLKIGVDVAASTFCSDKGYYHYKNKELIRDRKDQIEYFERLIDKYGLFYVEDALDEEDFSGFSELMNRVKSKKCLIVGDDLTTTNLKRVRRAVDGKGINALIVKPNQIGDLLEVKKVVEFCKKNKIKIIFSHRSGETMDTALADYAVGFGADFIKTGISGRERLVKLGRIMGIERK